MSIVYDIFSGDSAGGPIDYSSAIATSSGLSIALSALPLSSQTLFGVRPRDTVSGYSNLNTDANVLIIVDAAGNDATNRPFAPGQLRTYPGPSGTAIVEWSYPYLIAARQPDGFHVYLGTPSVSYGSPVATVLWADRIARHAVYRATLSGLSDGVVYKVGVRAYNASGEEPNTKAVSVTGATTPPSNVVSLAGALTT